MYIFFVPICYKFHYAILTNKEFYKHPVTLVIEHRSLQNTENERELKKDNRTMDFLYSLFRVTLKQIISLSSLLPGT